MGNAMGGYDKLANKYLDRVFPETRQVNERDLVRAGIDPSMHKMANEIVAEYEQQGNFLVPKPPTGTDCAGGGGGAVARGGLATGLLTVGGLAAVGAIAYFALR